MTEQIKDTNKSYTFLSSLQVHADFNPMALAQDISIVREIIEEGIRYTSLYFDAGVTEDGKIRAFMMLAEPIGETACPTMLILPNVSCDNFYKEIKKYNSHGLVVAILDYAGEGLNKVHHTIYPPSVNYLNFEEADERLIEAKYSARETCWFRWVEISRRAITLLQLRKSVDVSRLTLKGDKEGSFIAWQVAALDGRISACVIERGYIPPEPAILNSEERSVWLAGVAPQSYAQFINIPLLYVSSTNNKYLSHKLLWEIVSCIPNGENVNFAFTVGYSGQLVEEDAATITKFIDCIRTDDFARKPELTLKASEGVLYANLSAEEGKVNIWYSSGHGKSRNWKRAVAEKVGEVYMARLNIVNVDEEIYILGKVKYGVSDRYSVCSPIINIIPSTMGVLKAHPLRSKIIYCANMNTENVYATSSSGIIPTNAIKIVEGAKGLWGVTTNEVGLYFIRDNDKQVDMNIVTSIQIDIFSKEKRELVAQIFNSDENDDFGYTAAFYLSGGDEWQRITMELKDFKNEEFACPITWEGVYKLQFLNMQGALISNILWI